MNNFKTDSIYATKFYVMQKQIDDLQQENQQLKRNCNIGNENLNFYREEYKKLKNNWNYIKEMLKEVRNEHFNISGYCGTCTDVDIDFLLNKMEELERGVNK